MLTPMLHILQDDDFRAARRSIVYHPGPCPVMFPPSFFPRPHSPNMLPSSQSPVLPYSSGPGVWLSSNTLLTPSSARDSLFVLESDFPSQSCTEETVISPLSFSILPPDSQSGDSQEARAPVDLPIEKLVLEKDTPELVSGDKSEGDKAVSFAPVTPPVVTVDPFEEAKDEQVVAEETKTTASPTSSCIPIDCLKLHAMESASLPRSMGLLQDSEGSLSSSPTKLAYPVTEPGEFSTTESSGGQKKAECQKKPKSAKARKRAAKLQKTKQLARQSKQSSVNPETASHATDQQLQHTRKHRNKRTLTPELPQSTALSSDLPSSGEEKAQPTSETPDVPSGASPPTD
ncbi:unnamed protein product [Dibothriocephalus latus]|uniref:Uncharacterized protein n=1 Tax=Dibothriocephalus latus TaxID=60516 RepID=A0A3P6T3B5_DIBLA|nr:unnamed protein product [Dibothriocephalus latus]